MANVHLAMMGDPRRKSAKEMLYRKQKIYFCVLAQILCKHKAINKAKMRGGLRKKLCSFTAPFPPLAVLDAPADVILQIGRGVPRQVAPFLEGIRNAEIRSEGMIQ